MLPYSSSTQAVYAQLTWVQGWGCWLHLALSINPGCTVLFCLSEPCTHLRIHSVFSSLLSVAISPWMTTKAVAICSRLLQTHFSTLQTEFKLSFLFLVTPTYAQLCDLPLRYSRIQIWVCKLVFHKDKTHLCIMHSPCAAAYRSKENHSLHGPKQCIRSKRDQTKNKQNSRKGSRSKLLKMTENEQNVLTALLLKLCLKMCVQRERKMLRGMNITKYCLKSWPS